jgi:hypothetical protein
MEGSVSISGTPQYGEVLTADTSVNIEGSLNYQWKREGNTISGADGETYTLTSADIGYTLTVTVSGDGTNCIGSITSPATETVSKATYDMSGISFDDATATYDGTNHSLVIEGSLPSGVTVSYSGNSGTDVGTYSATASFAGDSVNFETIENRTAILTISKASIGSTGPAGGLVFYENPDYATEGWLYLEAAPSGWYGTTTDPYMQWGLPGNDYTVVPSAQGRAIGTGETNTTNIVSYYDGLGSYYSDATAYYTYCNGIVAAKECSEYSVLNGNTTYDDWFLPSLYELEVMYTNLKKNKLGGFRASDYWSSSEYDGYWAFYQGFDTEGICSAEAKHNEHRVRPVRAY